MLFSVDIGIDLGTTNTLVYSKRGGIVIREPSVVAVDVRMNPAKVVAVGEPAKRMVGRTPGAIEIINPLQDSVIADFDVTASMLRHFIKSSLSGSPFARARTLIAVPSNITEVERKAVHDAAKAAGARFVSLIETPMAAAIGAGLDVTRPMGTMIIDIGGGTTEVAVISLGDIVASKTIKTAGNEINNALIQYMKREHNLLIGDSTAEDIKRTIGSAYITDASEKEQTYVCKGRNLSDGLPGTKEITASQFRDAIADSLRQILDAIKVVLEKTPPELASDIMSQGIVLTGGGVNLRGLNELIAMSTEIPVVIAEKPEDCVITGIAICLQKNTLNIVR